MAECLNYIQLPLATFLQLHPEYLQLFPLRIFHDPVMLFGCILHPAPWKLVSRMILGRLSNS